VTVKDCGPQITTAASVCSSIDAALKEESAAYHPEVARLAQDSRKLGAELARLVGTTRSLLARAIAGVQEGKKLVALLG
jgi:hypothetical protein